jgi:hypothetical protein
MYDDDDVVVDNHDEKGEKSVGKPGKQTTRCYQSDRHGPARMCHLIQVLPCIAVYIFFEPTPRAFGLTA